MTVTFERVLEGFTIVEDTIDEVYETDNIHIALEQQITELLIKQELGVM